MRYHEEGKLEAKHYWLLGWLLLAAGIGIDVGMGSGKLLGFGAFATTFGISLMLLGFAKAVEDSY